MLVNVPVKRTTPPGVVVATSALAVISSSDTATVLAQRGSVVPVGQLFPGAVEARVAARVWSPVSGLFTVTV